MWDGVIVTRKLDSPQGNPPFFCLSFVAASASDALEYALTIGVIRAVAAKADHAHHVTRAQSVHPMRLAKRK